MDAVDADKTVFDCIAFSAFGAYLAHILLLNVAGLCAQRLPLCSGNRYGVLRAFGVVM